MKVAIPTNNQRTIANHIGLAKGFLIVDTNTNEEFYVKNPVLEINEIKEIKNRPEHNRGLGVGRIIPPLLSELGVDALIARDFGEGMIRNLEFEGIKALQTDIKDRDKALNNIDNLEKITIDEDRFQGFRGGRFGRFRNSGRFGRRGFGRRRFLD